MVGGPGEQEAASAQSSSLEMALISSCSGGVCHLFMSKLMAPLSWRQGNGARQGCRRPRRAASGLTLSGRQQPGNR